MHAGDAGADAFAHRAHGVQRFAPAGAGVHHDRDAHGMGDVAADGELFIHRQQGFADGGAAAGDKAAVVNGLEADAFGEACGQRVVHRGEFKEFAGFDEGAELSGGAFHYGSFRLSVSRSFE